MKEETLYSPKILIIGIIVLIGKFLLDYKLSGSLSVETYFDRNILYNCSFILCFGLYKLQKIIKDYKIKIIRSYEK